MIYEFAATQDLHGWGKPWAPGANINIWDEEAENGALIFQYTNPNWGQPGSGSANDKRTKNYIPVQAEETYYAVTPGSAAYAIFYDSNYDPVMVSENAGYMDIKNKAFTVPAGAAYMKFYMLSYGPTYKYDTAINFPATVTTYSPYANVCMPEGFNIWDPTNQEYVQVYAGYVNANTRELYLRPVYQEYAGEELVGPWMSDIDKYSEEGTPTEGAFVIDFGGELTSYEITPFMLQTLLDSLGIRQNFTNGAGLLNSLMDQAQGRVRSEEELLHLSRPLKVIAIGDQLPAGITFKPISKDVLPGLPGKFIR